MDTEVIKEEEEGNKSLVWDNQGDKEDALDNLAVEFDKIKFAMLEQQHGVNHLQLADKDGCLIPTVVSWFPDIQRGAVGH